MEVVLEVDDGEVVVGIVVVRAGLSSESHAGEWAELGGHVSLEGDVKVDEEGRDVETLHFEHFEHDGLTMLALIEGRVVVCDGLAGGGVSLTPRAKVVGSLAAVRVDAGGAIGGIEHALVFLHGAEGEDDMVVHEGESLAGLPRLEEGGVVDLVLRLGEYADVGEAPIGVGPGVVGNDGGLGLGGKLSVFVDVDTLGEKDWVEGNAGMG